MNSRLLGKTTAVGIAGCALIAAAAFLVGWYQFHAIGREIAARTLATAHALQVHIDEERLLKLESETNSIAANADFVAATIEALHVGDDGRPSPDTTTIHNQIESRCTQFGFDAAALLSPAGTTLATAGDGYLYRRDLSKLGAVAQTRNGAALASGMLDADGHLYHISVAALSRQSATVALLLTARRIDEAAIAGTATLSMTDRAYIEFGPGPPQVALSTLSPEDAQALAGLMNAERDAWQSRAASTTSEPFEIEFGGRPWYAQVAALRQAGNSMLRLTLVPPTWRDPVLAAIAPPLALAAAFGVVVLGLGLGSFWFRTIRPLVNLERLIQRVRHGDYALHGAETGSTLARRVVHAVNGVLGELARFRVAPGSPRRRETDLR
jgi:hypothetical protein